MNDYIIDEYMMGTSERDVIWDMVENMTTDEIVDILIDCDVTFHDDYIEHQKQMAAEYWEDSR